MQINPYLQFPGTCEAAFQFYESALGGKITFKMTHGQAPMAAPPGWEDKIMHATLTVGDAVFMGSDAPPNHYQKPAGSTVSISIKDLADAEKIFANLSEGANIIMPLQKTFWAQGFGMLTDRFGTPWMINCE